MRAMKKYIALSVWLNVDRKFAAANGCLQFCICVKAPTKKRVAELVQLNGGGNTSLHVLNSFNGLHENPTYKFDPPEDEEIYFHNEHHGTPHWGEWLKLSENRRIT